MSDALETVANGKVKAIPWGDPDARPGASRRWSVTVGGYGLVKGREILFFDSRDEAMTAGRKFRDEARRRWGASVVAEPSDFASPHPHRKERA